MGPKVPHGGTRRGFSRADRGVLHMPRPVLRVIRGVRQKAIRTADASRLKAELAALLMRYPGGSAVLDSVLAEVDRETTPSDGWDFTMSNPAAASRVLDLIRERAARPMLSLNVWARVNESIHAGTGVLLLTRAELAEFCGAAPRHISSVLNEFRAWNVLLRHQSGRSVVWQLNPHIATRLAGGVGQEARRKAGPVLRLAAADGDCIEHFDRPELVP